MFISSMVEGIMNVGFHVSHLSLKFVYTSLKLLLVPVEGCLKIENAPLVMQDVYKETN